MEMGPNWYQIGNKICYIQNVSKFYVENPALAEPPVMN